MLFLRLLVITCTVARSTFSMPSYSRPAAMEPGGQHIAEQTIPSGNPVAARKSVTAAQRDISAKGAKSIDQSDSERSSRRVTFAVHQPARATYSNRLALIANTYQVSTSTARAIQAFAIIISLVLGQSITGVPIPLWLCVLVGLLISRATFPP
ncbi:hypothetical protein PGT21_034222 [Puccinia graminis f. sp. tritici]|uniref:Uncharacterized protein n=1 Tax=Puccinia graminis f. sp. tritici TaxID=56615 RepID=A0A5B0LNX8_PUCGR|nr:hypothetical protein PGTUg99_019721 [Puccinia graminis f. sp. tritici]KAA1094986.1 hypothetical protein PGT21_034222 [Puccinia graminis f. sp. tritici]